MSREYEQYLGDGVYYFYDGYSHWLETSDGMSVTNRICLEPDVFARLKHRVEQVVREEQEKAKLRIG